MPLSTGQYLLLANTLLNRTRGMRVTLENINISASILTNLFLLSKMVLKGEMDARKDETHMRLFLDLRSTPKAVMPSQISRL